MAIIWISLAGGIGTCIRWYFSVFAAKFHTFYSILGLAIINMLGSFLIGLCTVLIPEYISPTIEALCTIGFCGGLTSFSTLQLDSAKLIDNRTPLFGLINLISNPLASLICCGLGTYLGTVILH